MCQAVLEYPSANPGFSDLFLEDYWGQGKLEMPLRF